MVVPNIEMLSKWQPARLKNGVPIKTAVLLSHIYIRYFIALTLPHLIFSNRTV